MRPHAHDPNTSPPRLARWLVRLAAPNEDAPFVLDDLNESFARRRLADLPRARRWYWHQALASVLPLLRRRLEGAVAAPATPSLRGDPVWTQLLDDLRFGIRVSARSPVATLAVIITTVVGIGATNAVFSAANAILFKPLPFAQSERLVTLRGTTRDGRVIPQLAYPDLNDFRTGVPEFAALTAYSPSQPTLQHGTDPRIIRALHVDEHYARVFSITPFLGRFFTADDRAEGAAKVVVLSYGFWQREFGGDRAIIDSTILLDDRRYTVVGVLARGAYTHPIPDAEVLFPLVIPGNSFLRNRGAMWAGASALLAPGVTSGAAQRDLGAVADRLGREMPNTNGGIGARIVGLQEAVVGAVRPMLVLLGLTVAAVLLIACANVANVLLERAQARVREFAVRSALGGTPGRIRRQILTESLLLATVGGLAGIALAPALARGLVALYPGVLPRAAEITVDWRVLAISVVAVLLAGLLSGYPATRRTVRVDLTRDLRDGGRTLAHGGRAGNVLIAAQLATSLALLVSAALLLETFRGLDRIDPGFTPTSTLSFRLGPSFTRYRTASAIAQFYRAVLDSARAIPGVQAAATASMLPFSGSENHDVWVQEERGNLGPQNPSGIPVITSPGYLRTLGVPLLRGRWFTAADDAGSERVVVINEAAARRFYAGEDPLGRFIRWNAGPHWRIVGVVGSTRANSLSQAPQPMLFAPMPQMPQWPRYVVVRANLPPDVLLPALRARLQAIDPTVALADPATMTERIDKSLGPQRFRAVLVTSIAALALLLSVVGVYGVVAYAVSRRTREIGIRMALGEDAFGVRRHVIGGVLRVAGAGLAVGLLLSLAAGRWLSGFLVGVSASDPRILAAAVAALLVIVVAAADAPARRASRVDPILVMREE